MHALSLFAYNDGVKGMPQHQPLIAAESNLFSVLITVIYNVSLQLFIFNISINAVNRAYLFL